MKRSAMLGVGMLFLVGACGGDTEEGPGPAADRPAEAATVAVAEVEAGEILVDADGMSLYLFTQDSDGESTCYDDCAQTWPPLEADGEPTAGEGADAALLGTVERDDGATQVTYGGMPLYRYAPDQEPGDTMGQGVGGVWFLVTPSGEALGEDDGSAGIDY